MFKGNKKIPEWRHWRGSGVFIINFEHLNFARVFIAVFEQVNVS